MLEEQRGHIFHDTIIVKNSTPYKGMLDIYRPTPFLLKQTSV